MSSYNAAPNRRVADDIDLHYIVNNAAQVAGADRTVTKEGIPTQLATNHFGHFVLTATLLPLLEQTAKLLGSDVRVVNVRLRPGDISPN